MTNIAEKLKSLRIEHGFSQEKLAEQLMVSRQAISKWENGETLPDMENMIALAKLYNTSLDDLIGINVGSEKNQDAPQNCENADENTALETTEEDMDEDNEDSKDDDTSNKDSSGPKSSTIKILRSLPYPIIVAAIFLFIGSITHEWHVAWILFVTIPIYYSVLECISARRLSHFAYPVLATTIYLYCGMKFGIWHPSWIIFLTIPIYDHIAAEIDKAIARKNDKK